MNPQSASALVWVAGSSILLGLLIMSPGGRFAGLVVATLLAAVPAIFARKRPRIAGIVVFALALALLLASYPAFDAEMTRYRQRAGARSTGVPQPPPPQQPERR